MEIDKQSGQSGELGSVYWAEPKGRSVGRSGRSGGGGYAGVPCRPPSD